MDYTLRDLAPGEYAIDAWVDGVFGPWTDYFTVIDSCD
jgi:hypothetical protein